MKGWVGLVSVYAFVCLQDVGHGGTTDTNDAQQLQSGWLRRSDDDYRVELERRLDQSSRFVDVRTVGCRESRLHDAVRLGHWRQ